MATTGQELTLRPMRPADRDRVAEISRDVWDGHDYIPRVFDDWVADAGSTFQAAELEGTVVGLHRLRPYGPGLIWYEGLRVASTHRRQGLARTMLASAMPTRLPTLIVRPSARTGPTPSCSGRMRLTLTSSVV